MRDVRTALEFDRVRAALAERAATAMGVERAHALEPYPTLAEAQAFQAAVAEALLVPYRLGGIRDLRPLLQRAREGRRLEGLELVEAAHTLSAAAELKRHLLEAETEHLAELAARVGEHLLFRRRVAEALEEDGRVKDHATPKLRQIRRRMEPLRAQIQDRLYAVMDAHPEAVQERFITLRRDRYVIPVKAHLQHQVTGIVLDQSASGATVFLEPASVVPLNNELAKLRLEEEAEVQRVLFELTQALAADPEVDRTLEALATLDLVRAAASLAEDWRLARPRWGEPGRYRLQGLFHPLVANCVPNDLELDADRRLLLITGPNMGGKTVLLKSLGLAVLMAQAGLFVPAQAAELPWVDAILVDIGDEQSLEHSLSTYAAHLVRLEAVLQKASPRALVLIDELGSGTDPMEGAALSQAILEALLERGARGVITTHLTPLKAFAMERAGVLNASMAFDLERLEPTYRLVLGVPGRSYALAVARQLGFPEAVLARAEVLLGPEGRELEALLERLEAERRALQAELAQARAARAEAEALRAELEARLARIEAERQERLEAARAEADRLLKEVHERIRTLREQARQGESAKRDALRTVMQLRQQVRPEPKRPRLEGLKPGMTVEVPSYRKTGTVVRVDGEEAVVQIGVLKVSVPTAELRPRGEDAPRPKQAVVVKSGFEPELNVRGLTAVEAVEAVHDFISEALALKETPVRILHGKGTGALRRAIRDALKRDKRVASFHDAMPYEGGHGVTVVHLKV